jgi:hypothetical protein
MRNLAIIAFLTLVLAACNQEEASAPPAETNDSTQSSEPQAENENPATADDGGGAMDGAADQQASQPAASPAPANLSQVSQDAIDGCIDTLRAQQGAIGGTVTSTEFSEANSLVMLQDGNGAQWRCLVSNDGSNATVEAVGGAPAEENPATADDGGGAMDGAGMPAVGSPTDVTAFQGARGGQAEGGLQALGFEAIRSEGLTTFWFNRSSGACARITTSEGVYSEVVMLPAEDC